MRLALVLLLVAGVCGAAEIRDVVKSAELDAMLRRPGLREQALHERPNYAIWLKVHEGRAGPSETHPEADDILWIRRGSARVDLGARQHQVGAGDIVHIPRNTPHRIDPGSGRLEYIVVRVFPSGENMPPRDGFLAPRQMPEVVKKAEIDATIAKYDVNQPLHSAKNYTMNYVIYQGRSGPFEAHRGCVDVYFLQLGTARAYLGGEVQGAKEESPGEIRGAGVSGSREYDIGPGDLVVIPRMGTHHMKPAGGKLGYLLLKVWAE